MVSMLERIIEERTAGDADTGIRRRLTAVPGTEQTILTALQILQIRLDQAQAIDLHLHVAFLALGHHGNLPVIADEDFLVGRYGNGTAVAEHHVTGGAKRDSENPVLDGAGADGSSGADTDAVDAEFEEVKDDEKKD